MQKLVNHSFSKKEVDFVEQYKVPFEPPIKLSDIQSSKLDETGRKYVEVVARQKTSNIKLKIVEGDGKIRIRAPEGDFDISFFESITHREQLLFPFKVIDRINKFDMDIELNTAGMSCFAKLLRYAISNALCSFISVDAIEKLRLCNTLCFGFLF